MSDEEFQALVRQRLFNSAGHNGNARQKVGDLNAVDECVTQGWECVNTLPNGKVIVKLQSNADL